MIKKFLLSFLKPMKVRNPVIEHTPLFDKPMHGEDMHEGMTVIHSFYGLGTILEKRGSGPGTVITVIGLSDNVPRRFRPADLRLYKKNVKRKA